MCLLQLFAGLVELVDPEQEDAEVEAHRLGMRKDDRERAEAAERERRARLVEEPDRRGDPGIGVVRRLAGGGGELPLGRDRVVETLQRDAVEDLRAGSAGG